MSELIYLASPYTHDDPWVRQERYDQALRAYVHLLRQDKFVFCPIVMTHYADGQLRRAKDHAFWIRQTEEILQRCDKVIVLQIDGWRHSKGIASEVVMAARLGIPIEYMEWKT